MEIKRCTRIVNFPIDIQAKSIKIENILMLVIDNQTGSNFEFSFKDSPFVLLPNKKQVFWGHIDAPIQDVFTPKTQLTPDPTLTVLMYGTQIYEYEDKH